MQVSEPAAGRSALVRPAAGARSRQSTRSSSILQPAEAAQCCSAQPGPVLPAWGRRRRPALAADSHEPAVVVRVAGSAGNQLLAAATVPQLFTASASESDTRSQCAGCSLKMRAQVDRSRSVTALFCRAGEPDAAGDFGVRAVPCSGWRLACSLQHSGQPAGAPAAAARRPSRRSAPVGLAAAAAASSPSAAPGPQIVTLGEARSGAGTNDTVIAAMPSEAHHLSKQ